MQSSILRRLARNPAVRTAWQRHRNDPTTVDGLAPNDACVVAHLPHAQARRQWCALAKVEVLPFNVQRQGKLTRTAYAVPPDVHLRTVKARTRQGSVKAANRWWTKKLAELAG